MGSAGKSRVDLERELEAANKRIADLERENEQQKQFLERLGFPMFLCSPDGHVLLMSKPFADFLGDVPRKFIGGHLSQFGIHEWSRLFDHIRYTHETGEDRVYESEFLLPGGVRRWFHGHCYSVKDESGRRVAVQTIVRDITEEKQARIEQERVSERFKLAMEACQNVVWDWDVLTGDVYYSSGYKAMIGYSDEDFPQTVAGWSKQVHPDDWHKVREVNLGCIQGKFDRFDVEFRVRSKSGKWLWVLGRGQVVERNEIGNALRIVGTHTNITQFKEVAEHQQTLIDTAPSAIVTIDLEGNYTSWNSTWCEMLGYTHEEMEQGINAFTVTHPDDIDKGRRKVNSLLNGEVERYRDEKRFIRKDGSILWGDLSAAVLKDSDGKVESILGVLIDTSSRKEVEEALKISEERYRSMAEHMGSGMAVYEAVDNGEDFIFRGINPAAEKIARIDHKKDLGKRFLSLFPNMVDSDLLKAFQRVYRTGEPELVPPVYYEDAIGGGWRENRIYKLPSGEVVALFDDVTERIEATQALQESEERMQLALEAVNDGVWDWQLETGDGYYSPRWYAMLGYEAGELPPTIDTWSSLLHPDEREGVVVEVGSHLESGQSFQIEFRMRTKSGDWRWVMSRGMVMDVDENGCATRMLGTHVDITERVEALEALKESEKRFRNLLENVELVAVRGYNDNRETIFWNSACEKLYGYAQDEVLCKKCLIMGHDQAEEFAERIDSWLHDGEPFPAGELTMQHKDGSIRTVYSSHVMQVNSQGEREVYFIDVDMTAINKAYADLVEAKEQAEAASNAKSLFLANMSHELRTPLNGIMGMHHVLETTELNEEQQEYLALAQVSSGRLTNLLNDILDLTRVEAGRLLLCEGSFNLAELLLDVEQLFKASSKKEQAECQFIIDPLIPENLIGDSARLRQVISNLVGNGLKFTGTGNITVEAQALSPAKPEGLRVLFSVSDSGIGIPEEKVASIFESFTQVDESVTRSHQGAGLGLAIVSQLVFLMGGNMSVESEVDVGTTFYFSLPFKLEHGDIVEQTVVVADESNFDQSLNVLLVEDDFISIHVLQKVLEKNGCTVTTAENGRAAVDLVGKNEFDVIFMDVQMPEMDGTEATGLIRSGGAGSSKVNIPIIALTAHAMTGDKEKLLDAGMDDYISKPVNVALLKKTLLRLRKGDYRKASEKD